MAHALEYPDHLLADTSWDFANKDSYVSKEELSEAVKRHHHDVREYAEEISVDEWKPDEAILRAPRLFLRYYADPEDEEEGTFHLVELECDDGVVFTAGELLFKIHNAVIARLRRGGHHYFEGLTFARMADSGAPIYQMIGGS